MLEKKLWMNILQNLNKNKMSIWTCDKCGAEFESKKEAKKHEKNCQPEPTEEQQMAEIGYDVGEMCPFTQVKVGGTTNISSAVFFGAPTTDEFTWTHGNCLGKYCAIWDEKKKQCSIKTIANKR
jgi:hypothetical protein